MKILITDRELWLSRVNTALQWIYGTRISKEATYKPGFFDSDFQHPKYYWWQEEFTLKELKIALESDGTGEIWVGTRELRSVEPWQD